MRTPPKKPAPSAHPPAKVERVFDRSASGGGGELSGILSALEGFVSRLEPALYPAGEVPGVLKALARAEKLCATAKLLMSRRAAELHAGDLEGATSTARWLAGHSGEGVGKENDLLATAGGLTRTGLG